MSLVADVWHVLLFLTCSNYGYCQVNSTQMFILTFLKEVKNLILQDAMAICFIQVFLTSSKTGLLALEIF